MSNQTTVVAPISWTGGSDGFLTLLDQTKLPTEIAYLNCDQVDHVFDAIQRLSVRGAPAIGIAAAYGVVLALRDQGDDDNPLVSIEVAKQAASSACDHLAESRPTAVNLFWALDQMRKVIGATDDQTPPVQLRKRLLTEAKKIHEADQAQCAAIGRYGAELLGQLGAGAGIITHCNTGALATGGDGTALSVLFALHEAGLAPKVFADETRPLLQGARLTAWELQQRGLESTLICDSMAALVLNEGKAQAVIVGADRIASNGDTANKIGTYGLAVAARYHQAPFYVAAPTTTFDMTIATGEEIPIEQRKADEVTKGFGSSTAPEEIEVYNPAFDVTPAELITAIITERGVIKPVNSENLAKLVAE